MAAHHALPLNYATRILDLGCGPGILTSELIESYANSLPQDVKIVALDSAPQMIKQVSEIKRDSAGRWDNVEAIADDAHDLSSIPGDRYSHILAGLVLLVS